jgi:hypothetical protein
MSKLTHVLAFVAGAGVGAVVAWKVLAAKYDKLIQDEVESVKEHLGGRNKGDNQDTDEVPFEYEDAADEPPEHIMREYGTLDGQTIQGSRPYVIHPTQFGAHTTYDTRSLTCFADRVVTDTDENVIEDVESLIGDESLDHFGEYEMDSVFVRNDRLKCDFEILLDTRRYSDIKKRAHLAED